MKIYLCGGMKGDWQDKIMLIDKTGSEEPRVLKGDKLVKIK